MALVVVLASAALLLVALTHRPARRPAQAPRPPVAVPRAVLHEVVDAEVVAEWRRPASPLAARYAVAPSRPAATRRWAA